MLDSPGSMMCWLLWSHDTNTSHIGNIDFDEVLVTTWCIDSACFGISLRIIWMVYSTTTRSLLGGSSRLYRIRLFVWSFPIFERGKNEWKDRSWERGKSPSGKMANFPFLSQCTSAEWILIFIWILTSDFRVSQRSSHLSNRNSPKQEAHNNGYDGF